MTKTRLAQFKEKLLEEQKIVKRSLRHQLEEQDDRNDEVLEPLADSEEKLLEKILLALEKIDNGSYGICVSCSHEIPLERLEAKPSVSLCLDCQKKHETPEKTTP
jgi:DnaK suppressor protein